MSKAKSAKSELNKTDSLPKPTLSKFDTKRISLHEGEYGIPRNVNFYRHLIEDKATTDSEIEWVLKLRTPKESSKNFKMDATVTHPFFVGDKVLEGQKLKRVASDLNPKNKLNEIPHLYHKRLGPTPSASTVQFESGLRDYSISNEKLASLEKNWNNIPKKDRKEFPTMYPSYSETMRIPHWTTKNLQIQTHTAFDGRQNYPTYGQLTDRQPRNVSEIRHLLEAPGNTMSNIDWQLSMRGGFKVRKVKIEKDQENLLQDPLGKELGELKKINRRPKRI